jgi:hypothetical protein
VIGVRLEDIAFVAFHFLCALRAFVVDLSLHLAEAGPDC